MDQSSPLPERAVVADIGGTNARFAVANLATLELSHISHFPCSGHATLASAMSAYLAGLTAPPALAGIAVAAPVVGEEVRFINSPWSFTRSGLCRAAGLEALLVLNDFQAKALSLPHLAGAELKQIGGGEPAPHAPKIVLGPGTGIGVAGLVWSPSGWIAVPTEGGHIALAAENAREFALIEQLRSGRERVSVERALSGPGIVDLYRAVAKVAGLEVESPGADAIAARALARQDRVAEETLDQFVTWLGRFAGDAALFYGARGGVYIGGGIAPKIIEALSAGSFRRAFEEKGRMRSLLAPVPVYVILAPFAALKGAAAGLRAALEIGGEALTHPA